MTPGPQLWVVITVKFFEKMIFLGAREKTKIYRPWLPELWERGEGGVSYFS